MTSKLTPRSFHGGSSNYSMFSREAVSSQLVRSRKCMIAFTTALTSTPGGVAWVTGTTLAGRFEALVQVSPEVLRGSYFCCRSEAGALDSGAWAVGEA